MESEYPRTWRLILHVRRRVREHGHREAMLIALAEGISPPTLRFYGLGASLLEPWSQPTFGRR